MWSLLESFVSLIYFENVVCDKKLVLIGIMAVYLQTALQTFLYLLCLTEMNTLNLGRLKINTVKSNWPTAKCLEHDFVFVCVCSSATGLRPTPSAEICSLLYQKETFPDHVQPQLSFHFPPNYALNLLTYHLQ